MRKVFIATIMATALPTFALDLSKTAFPDPSKPYPPSIVPLRSDMKLSDLSNIHMFVIANYLSVPITEVSVAPAGSQDDSDWSPDFLADRKFEQKTRLAFAFLPAAQKPCLWNIYIEAADGAYQRFQKALDICDKKNAYILKIDSDSNGYLTLETEKKAAE